MGTLTESLKIFASRYEHRIYIDRGSVTSSKASGNDKRLLLSCLAYDKGKSGIAHYTNALAKALQQQRPITLAILRKDLELFPVPDEKMEIMVVSNFFAKPVLSIFWHWFVLPILALWHQYDFVILPVMNRRMSPFLRVRHMGILHDVSNFYIEDKYNSPIRDWYLMHVLKAIVSATDNIVAISEASKADMIKFWNVKPEGNRHFKALRQPQKG